MLLLLSTIRNSGFLVNGTRSAGCKQCVEGTCVGDETEAVAEEDGTLVPVAVVVFAVAVDVVGVVSDFSALVVGVAMDAVDG